MDIDYIESRCGNTDDPGCYCGRETGHDGDHKCIACDTTWRSD